MVAINVPENVTYFQSIEIDHSSIEGTNKKETVNLSESLQSNSINHIYNKLVGQKKEAKTLKNLLTNLHNKLSTIDSTLEISFESIQTKIK